MEHFDWFVAAQEFLKGALQGVCRGAQAVGRPDFGCKNADGTSGTGSFWLENVASMPFRTRDDVGKYLDDVAESLTRKMRMGMNADETGEGKAADVLGLAMQTTVCFAVTWDWLILPAALTVMAVLALTWKLIIDARGLGHGEMVWKGSLLPLLYHREHFLEADGHGADVEKRDEWLPLMPSKDMTKRAEWERVVFQEWASLSCVSSGIIPCL